MTSVKPFLADGDSNNKPQCFVGEYYKFWKIYMQIYLEAQWDEIWETIQNGPFITTTAINNVEQPIVKDSWNNDDKKNVLFIRRQKIYLNLP